MIPPQFYSAIPVLVIDASSIIYLLKIGLLGSLAAEVRLVSTPQVIEETGWPHLPVEGIPIDDFDVSNDESLIVLAAKISCPVLSEDYEILKSAAEKGWDYYNTLMILNYLLMKGRISAAEYPRYLERLKECAHYSEKVLAQGALVYQEILGRLESHD